MIDLYYWTTPNGHKITLFLEEAGLPYRSCRSTSARASSSSPTFLAISPNNRMPAIVDHAARRRRRADGGVRVRRDPALPRGEDREVHARRTCAGRCRGAAWLFWQMGGLGPWPGRTTTSSTTRPRSFPTPSTRYVKETNRLYGVLNKRLADRDFIARRTTPSPTWPAIRGSSRTSGRARTSRTSRT